VGRSRFLQIIEKSGAEKGEDLLTRQNLQQLQQNLARPGSARRTETILSEAPPAERVASGSLPGGGNNLQWSPVGTVETHRWGLHLRCSGVRNMSGLMPGPTRYHVGAGFGPPRRCQMHVPRKFALLDKRRSSRASSCLTATGGGLLNGIIQA
jgi:hypothetical protein